MEQNDRLKRRYGDGPIFGRSSRNADRLLKNALRRISMGEVRVKVVIENYDDRVRFKDGRLAEKDIRSREVEAVVDTGAVSRRKSRQAVGGRLPG